MAPDSWQRVKLGKHATKVGSGLTPRGGQAVYQQSGIPFIRSQNVHINRFAMEGLAFISSEQDEEMRQTRVQPGDVLLNITGASIGRVCVVPDEICPANVNQHVCIIRSDGTIDPHFLALFISTPDFQQFIQDNQSGATRQALTKQAIEDFRVPLPPLPEQQRIAEALSKADRLRRLRRTARELSDTYLQSVFLEMFGDPVSNPREWEIQPLGNSVDKFEGGVNFAPVSEGEEASEWRVLKVSAVTWGDFDPEASKPISPDVKFDESIVARRGDLLISRANTTELVGAVCLVTQTPPKVLLPDKIWRICFSENSKLLPEYTLWALRQAGLRKIIGDLATGTSGSMKNISKQKAATLPIPLAPVSLQQRFTHIVHKFERLRVQQREAERQSEHLFQTLLYRAFQGEL
jgi:type I restriction enzyme S subunit